MKIITVLIILALIATVVSMVVGVGSMAKGGAYDDKHSGQFQAVAAILLMLALFMG